MQILSQDTSQEICNTLRVMVSSCIFLPEMKISFFANYRLNDDKTIFVLPAAKWYSTANILLVKKATLPCLLFPVYFQCIFSIQEVL